jgi:hypothetical protein
MGSSLAHASPVSGCSITETRYGCPPYSGAGKQKPPSLLKVTISPSLS